MKKLILIVSLFILPSCILAQAVVQDPVLVKIRVLDLETNSVTPVMACITSTKDNKVRIPPYAAIMDSVSKTQTFYNGIEFNKDKNWIGPIRKMNGQGDNNDRSYVYRDLPSIPYWTAPVSYQTSGDFSITLQPGTWQINLEHGNEYIPLTVDFEVPKGKKEITKTFVLKRWIDLPQLGWYSGDVHVHHPTTKPGFKKFLLEYAKAEDLHLVNILEMGHHENDETEFKQEGFGEKFDMNDDDFWLVSGQEAPRSTFGHIIGLNISQLIQDVTNYDYYDLAFQRLHEQPGALVGYAHFSWNGCNLPRGFPWYVTTGKIDFVELLQFSKINTLDYYDYLNLGFRITAAAGSDVPWGSTIGEVRTFVYTGQTFNADTWFEGVKNGHTFVSNGPALLLEADGNLPGSEIIQSQGANSNIKVKALSHPSIGTIERVAIYTTDGLLTEKLNPEKSDSILIELNHKLDKSQWLAAVVYCDNGAVAHTTPVYYIVDGKPTWSAKKAPAIIEKQMGLIRKIEEETKAKEIIDKGILYRLEMAKKYYRMILEEIKK